MPARCHHTEFRRKAQSLILSRPTPRGFAGTRRGEPFLWDGHVPGAKKTGGAEAPPFSLLFAYSPLRSYTARTYFRPRQMVARHTAMENPPHRDTHSR